MVFTKHPKHKEAEHKAAKKAPDVFELREEPRAVIIPDPPKLEKPMYVAHAGPSIPMDPVEVAHIDEAADIVRALAKLTPPQLHGIHGQEILNAAKRWLSSQEPETK